MAGRYICESTSGGKFWEIERDGLTLRTRYGKVGAKGRATTKAFDTEEKAEKSLARQVKAKLKKGYCIADDGTATNGKGKGNKTRGKGRAKSKGAKKRKARPTTEVEIPFSQHVYVLTGSMTVTQSKMEKLINDNGAKVSKTVTKSTTHLLLGKNGKGTAKHKQALEKGLCILDEESVREKFGAKQPNKKRSKKEKGGNIEEIEDEEEQVNAASSSKSKDDREDKMKKFVARYIDSTDSDISSSNLYRELVGTYIPKPGDQITMMDPADCGTFFIATIKGTPGELSTYHTSCVYEHCDHINLVTLLTDYSWVLGNYQHITSHEAMLQMMKQKLELKNKEEAFFTRVRTCGERQNSESVTVGDLMIKRKHPKSKLLVCIRSVGTIVFREWDKVTNAIKKRSPFGRVEEVKAIKWKANYFAYPAMWVHAN